MNNLVVLLDNYDSFTYNLYQLLCAIGSRVHVFRNDQIDVPELAGMRPAGLVISPGPKAPADAGISKTLIKHFKNAFPILGVCLGHQCINEVFGGTTVRAPAPCHGKTTLIHHDGRTIFAGLPPRISVARYHSLIAERASISQELEITAWTPDGLVMGLRHRQLPIEGVQFHPESFLTEYGRSMLTNFLSSVRGYNN